jgi:peptidoglycan/LPS O-acetylase OafA/YrhL
MVLLFHSSLNFQAIPFFSEFEFRIEHLSRGVQLFFAISAFSLFHSMSFRDADRSQPIFNFYVRRFFRIVPLWWLAVIVYSLISMHPLRHNFLTAVFAFGFYYDAWTICTIPVGWSLFVEVSFYLFFPLWWKFIRNTWSAFCFLVLGVAAAFIWSMKMPNLGLNYLAISPVYNYFSFFLGIFIFYAVKQFADVLKKPSSVLLLNVTSLLGFVLIFYVDRIVGTLALTPFILASLSPTTWIGKIVRKKILIHFGICCYSIYLFHPIPQGWINLLTKYLFQTLNMPSAYRETQTILAFVMLAFVSYLFGTVFFYLLEKPLVKFGKILLRK